MAWFVCLEQLPARPLIFSFGLGVTFGPGRGTAGGCSVTPCQGVFLIRRVSCGLVSVPGTIACQTLDFFIRFRSDVWPGQRDGRGCSVTPCQGVFLIRRVSCGLVCVPGTIACQTLDFSFGSGVTFGPGRGTAGGCSVTPCQGVFLIRRVSCGLVCVPGTIACQTLDFFIRFRSDVWPGQRDGRRLFRHAVPGCFPDSKGVLWLGLCAWNNCLPDP